VIVRRVSSPLSHNAQVRVLVVEDRVALADRIGEGLSAICPRGQRQSGQRHGDSRSCPTESR
jgi:hypothetical protein